MTRHVNIDENDVNAIFGFNEWKRFGVKLTESTQKVEETQEEHSCPLCKSHLDEALSQETLKEHVATVIGMVEETLAEAVDEIEADEDSEDVVDEDDVELEDSDAEDSEDSDEEA